MSLSDITTADRWFACIGYFFSFGAVVSVVLVGLLGLGLPIGIVKVIAVLAGMCIAVTGVRRYQP